jgi:lipopolysaccharide/colanic/teichoic acid biosynthesis glycosyltransferase
VFSLLALLLLWWLIALCWLIASVDTRSNGFFSQQRIGRFAKPFSVYKIKTMHNAVQPRSSITANCRSEVSKSGAWMRRFKLDELPQLWNVFIGDMSFVGPRPDVPGYADCLQGDERQLLELRPGITGPASIKYRHEDNILAQVNDAKSYNDTVIWPDKVRINLDYYHHYSFWLDLRYIVRTFC